MFKQICIVCFFIHAASLHLDHDNSRALNNAANLQKIRDTIVAAGERMISASPNTSADGEIIKGLTDMRSLLEKPEMMGQLGENRGSFRPLAESSDALLQRSFLADPVAVGLRDDILKKLSANDQARKKWAQNFTLEPASFLSLMDNTKQEFAPLKKDIISLFQRISTITSSNSSAEAEEKASPVFLIWGLPGPPGFSFNFIFPGAGDGQNVYIEVRIRPNANWFLASRLWGFNVESKYRIGYEWANGLKVFLTGYDEAAWFKGGPGFFLPKGFPKSDTGSFASFKFQLYIETRFFFTTPLPGVNLIPAIDYGWNWWSTPPPPANSAFLAQWTVLDVKKSDAHFQIAPVFIWSATAEFSFVGWGLEGLGFYREGGAMGVYPPATFLGRFIDFMCKLVFGPNAKCPDSTKVSRGKSEKYRVDKFSETSPEERKAGTSSGTTDSFTDIGKATGSPLLDVLTAETSKTKEKKRPHQIDEKKFKEKESYQNLRKKMLGNAPVKLSDVKVEIPGVTPKRGRKSNIVFSS